MRFITLDGTKKVVGIREGPGIVEGEIQSDTGELGQILQSDGTFITPVLEEEVMFLTWEDKLNFLYYRGLGVI